MQSNQLYLSRDALMRTLSGVAICLVGASVAAQLARFGLERSAPGVLAVFSLGREQNLPTFFSALLMILATLLLAVIASLAVNGKKPDVSRWVILSGGFLLMAYDELFSVHESLIRPVRSMMGDLDLPIFHFAWVVPGIVLVLVLGLFFAGFLLRLPPATRRIIVIAATLYLGGAIFVEMIEGAFIVREGPFSMTYAMIVTVEESLEMAGLLVFLYALLGYLADTYRAIEVRFAGVGGDTAI